MEQQIPITLLMIVYAGWHTYFWLSFLPLIVSMWKWLLIL